MAYDGSRVAQMAILAGADDAGSTMMEENVVSASGTKKTLAKEELQSSIIRAGFTPVKETDYNHLETKFNENKLCSNPITVNSQKALISRS